MMMLPFANMGRLKEEVIVQVANLADQHQVVPQPHLLGLISIIMMIMMTMMIKMIMMI